MNENLVSDALLPEYFKFTKSDQILMHLGMDSPPANLYFMSLR